MSGENQRLPFRFSDQTEKGGKNACFDVFYRFAARADTVVDVAEPHGKFRGIFFSDVLVGAPLERPAVNLAEGRVATDLKPLLPCGRHHRRDNAGKIA